MLIAFFISLIAGLSTVIGALIIFVKIKEKNINKVITFFLSFSLLIMILISITDLIPPAFFSLLNSFGITTGQYIAVIAFLIGYTLVIILNICIKQTTSDNLFKLGLLNAIALVLHNFPEGIATFMSSYNDLSLGLKLSFAVMLHNIPEGISIAIPIYHSTKSRSKALKFAFISGLAEPVGALIAFLFLKQHITENFINVTLIFVGGLMITLAIKEIYPKVANYQEKKFIYLGFISAFIFFIILFIFLK